MRERKDMSTKLERQQRQREYHLLRNQVQELREKVEPIKHSRRMDRLSAEKAKLQNFLERSGEKLVPIKTPGFVYTCGNPGCEGECGCTDYRISTSSLPIKPFPKCSHEHTHPFHSNCGSGLCHAEGCICAMCFIECLSCRCHHCRNGIYENCIFLEKNKSPIKTELPHSNAQALQDARARKALDDYKSSLQRLAAMTPIHEEDLYGLHLRLEDSDDGVIQHLYNCGCENCQNEEPIKSKQSLCKCGKLADVRMNSDEWQCGDCAGESFAQLVRASIPAVSEPIKPTIRECECGNEALSQYETCLACHVGVGRRNQETPLEIAPAVSNPITHQFPTPSPTEHLNGECGNPEGCDYCISVG